MQDSFTNNKYKTLKRKIKLKSKRLVCANCYKRNKKNKFKTCTGCAKIVYCSRRCQKIHWNKTHNKTCCKEWRYEQHGYPNLTTPILNCVNQPDIAHRAH